MRGKKKSGAKREAGPDTRPRKRKARKWEDYESINSEIVRASRGFQEVRRAAAAAKWAGKIKEAEARARPITSWKRSELRQSPEEDVYSTVHSLVPELNGNPGRAGARQMRIIRHCTCKGIYKNTPLCASQYVCVYVCARVNEVHYEDRKKENE